MKSSAAEKTELHERIARLEAELESCRKAFATERSQLENKLADLMHGANAVPPRFEAELDELATLRRQYTEMGRELENEKRKNVELERKNADLRRFAEGLASAAPILAKNLSTEESLEFWHRAAADLDPMTAPVPEGDMVGPWTLGECSGCGQAVKSNQEHWSRDRVYRCSGCGPF
jgi:DNA repair exonuclease SbcCD ATPase subunit